MAVGWSFRLLRFPCLCYGRRGPPTLASSMKHWEAQMQLSGQPALRTHSLHQDSAKPFPDRLSRSPQIALWHECYDPILQRGKQRHTPTYVMSQDLGQEVQRA